MMSQTIEKETGYEFGIVVYLILDPIRFGSKLKCFRPHFNFAPNRSFRQLGISVIHSEFYFGKYKKNI